jgi:hypothetical protein
MTTIAPHVYKLDLDNHRAGGEPRCDTCKGQHTDEGHVKHRRGCKDRYGNGSPSCPACKLEAEALAVKCEEVGCKTSPYSQQCGHAMSNKPSCGCGRHQSTD